MGVLLINVRYLLRLLRQCFDFFRIRSQRDVTALGAEQGVNLHVRGFEFQEFGIVGTEVDFARRMKRAGFQFGVYADGTGRDFATMRLHGSFLSVLITLLPVL
jgi:hypothetical protein